MNTDPHRLDPVPAFGATLVSALSPAEVTRTVGVLFPTAPTRVGTSVLGTDQADSLDLGFRLGNLILERARAGHRGNLVIEIDPAANVQEVALMMEHVLFSSPEPPCPVGIRELLTIVRLGDVRTLLFQEGRAATSGIGLTDIERAETLAVQLEYATVVVLTGTEGVAPELVAETTALIRQLNPTAVLSALELRTAGMLYARPVRGPVAAPLTENRGWMMRLDPARDAPMTSGRIGSVVFRDPRPFHPGRLAGFVQDGCDPAHVGLILRSRGVVRLATRPFTVGSWASAGAGLELDPTAIPTWNAETPAGEALVFFGRDLKEGALLDALADCLVTMPELLGGPALWHDFFDPFPRWNTENG